MSASTPSSLLSITETNTPLFIPYGAKESCLTVGVLNSGSQAVTVVGSGWSFPAEDGATSRYEPSLDTIFQQPIPIAPGISARVRIPISVDEAFTAEPRFNGCLRIFSDHEQDFADSIVQVRLLPEVTIRPDKFVVRKPGLIPLECTLASESELPDISVVKGKHLQWKVKRLSSTRFHLTAQYQAPGHFLRETVDDTLEILFSGIEHTLIHPIRISLERCAEPELKLAGETALECNVGRERVYFVSVTNLGIEELTIHEVAPIVAEGAVVVLPDHGLNGLRIGSMMTSSFPILVWVDLSTQPGTVLDVGVRITSNSESKPEADLRLALTIKRYPGSATPIGFDFGTVNSCIAHIDETLGEAQLLQVPVEIEPGKFSQQEIFPSVLHVETLPDESGEFRPGLWLITSRKDTFNLTEVKTAFCRGEKVSLRYSDGIEHSLDTRRCLSQFLEYVLSHAEHQLEKSFRECVITVPTKYGSRAVEQMREAVRRIGLAAGDVHVYDESTSAAIFYVRRGRNSEFLRPYELPQSYSLVIMDVGGGTTDVSILDVTDGESRDHRKLEVTLRGTTGRIRFGGTHFNNRVKRGWFEEYAEVCAALGVPLIPISDLDLEQRQQLLVPEGQLADAIETAKCRLRAKPAWPYERIDAALQSYTFLAREYPPAESIEAQKLPPDLTALTQNRLHELIGKDLNDIISEVQLMARSLAKNPLGAVLLVGQSSQLETIRETVTNAFGKDKVCLVPAETAKSCVVQGALELHQLLRNPGGVDFSFRDLSHVLSCRIGMLWSGRYEMEFKELLPIGSDLPAESVYDFPKGALSKESFRVTFLANYGAKDAIKGNENIVRLGTYACPEETGSTKASRLRLVMAENGELTAYLVIAGREILLQAEK